MLGEKDRTGRRDRFDKVKKDQFDEIKNGGSVRGWKRNGGL